MAQAKDRKQAPGRRKTQSAGREQHADQRSSGNGGGASSRGHGGRMVAEAAAAVAKVAPITRSAPPILLVRGE